jgi:hypothetical protein
MQCAVDRSRHPTWRYGQHLIAAAGSADRRSAKNAAAPMDQSREALLAARPHHSPEGAIRMWAVGNWPVGARDSLRPSLEIT